MLIVPTLWLALVYLVLLPGEDFTYALINDVVAHAIYFPGFLFGWLLAGNEVLWGAVRRWWRLAAGVAICAIAALLSLEALSLTGQIEWTAETERLFEGLRALQGWPAILGLIGLFDRFANRNHRWRAPLNEAVFPAYIAHQTIIILVGWLLLRADIAGWPAFALLVVATVAGSAGFCLLGRIGWLRLFIGFGERRRKTQDVAEAVPPMAA